MTAGGLIRSFRQAASTPLNHRKPLVRFVLRQLWIWTIRLWLISGAAMMVAALILTGVVIWGVRYSDDSTLAKTAILSKMEEETSIYYYDDKERIGSLFAGNHRRYIPLRDVPAHMQNAIIAAEDKNFFLHRGVDFGAVLKAFYEGVVSGGRFRRGGSTLTQQTVKNIMGDWEATIARKFREMIKAMQLENLYDKEQILEFYLNQFHVAGNGNGIGIAANYYFNKDVMDLTLIEAAFIAGSVKSPSKYNPFMKRDKRSYEKALREAHRRKNYVLKRMYEQNWISHEEYQVAKNHSVPFEKGRFTTSDVALIQLIQKELGRKEILQTLGLNHLSELKTAGLKVYTTIDKQLQTLGQRTTRRHLARIQTILSGGVGEETSRFRPLKSLKEGDFAFGKIAKIREVGKNFEIHLSFGLPTGVLRHRSLVRAAKLLDLPIGHEGGYRHFLSELKKTLKVGDVLFVEIKSYDPSTHKAEAELYKHPEVSGGFVALDKGEVRAAISGFDTAGFNRAIYGKRQPGSVFKVPTLLAALQLGWNILDPLYNERQVFSYQGNQYYPRPDHLARYPRPSLIWSGTMSENLAFVYLVAHLLDKLSFTHFKQLLTDLALAPRPRENKRAYQNRLTRKLGVHLNTEGIRQQFLKQAVKAMEPDLIFARQKKLVAALSTLWWGQDYAEEIQSLQREDAEKYSAREIARRLVLARNNYRRYERLMKSYESDFAKLEEALALHNPRQIFFLPDLAESLKRFGVFKADGKWQIVYHRTFEDELFAPEHNALFEEELHEEVRRQWEKDSKDKPDHSDDSADVDNSIVTNELTEEEQKELEITERMHQIMASWPVVPFYSLENTPHPVRALTAEDLEKILAENTLSDPESILLDGRIPVSVYNFLEEFITAEMENLARVTDPYELHRYFHHHDFRIALGLHYIKQLCRILGVDSHISPVLSLPLGTNVVTTLEVAKLYQTITTGKIYQFFDSGPVNQISFIRRIEDRYGKVLYESKPKSQAIIEPIILSQLTDVLRKIVTHGTGRRANRELYIDLESSSSSSRYKIRIPAFGKTGSTNDFTTSYFAGFVPYPEQESALLSLDNIYTVATYVGYDIPRMMKNGRISIYGGTAALPLWTDFFRQIIDLKDYRSYLDAYDIDLLTHKEWLMDRDDSLWEPMRLDLPRGLVLGKISEKYVEDYKLTNLAETGEEYVNEFLNVHSVIGQVFAPAPLDLKQPLPRVYAPLTKKTLAEKTRSQ